MSVFDSMTMYSTLPNFITFPGPELKRGYSEGSHY